MTMRQQNLLRIPVLAAALMFAMPAIAAAHAYPSSEKPAAGAILNSSPARVAIDFGAPIEQLFSKLKVLDGRGQDKTIGTPAVSTNHHELSVGLAPLTPGNYTVNWSVVAEDGHRTEGSYAFTVRSGTQ